MRIAKFKPTTAIVIMMFTLFTGAYAFAQDVTLYCPPGFDPAQAKVISDGLSEAAGIEIHPQIAKSYPEMVDAFGKNDPTLVYVGSFVQALLYARGSSTPLVQAVNGQEFYTAVLIAPAAAGSDPQALVKSAGAEVAFAKGASSGESGAKAATEGAANVSTNNHLAAVNAIQAGKAKCAFVKDLWWEANKSKFEDMQRLEYPGVSDHKNPDNVLTANKAIQPADAEKIKAAAMKNPKLFSAVSLSEFDPALLGPTLDLMKKAKIDPKEYSWN